MSVLDDALGLGSQALHMAQTRLEILAIDLEREKSALARELILAAACGTCAALGAFAAVLWVALSFEPRARFIALAVLTGLFVVAAIVLALVLRGHLRRRERLFSRIIDTLKRDSASLKPR